ncbi:MAG: DnaD domain protein [Clostridia bacterium]|nr:DnaD domain protein [Clostridia bacterium]
MILNPISQGPEDCYIRVPEAAVDKLIQTGNTAYLAVYMFALSEYYRGKTDISNGFIADSLHMNVMDVVNAFLFCASEGLLTVHNFTSVADAEFDITFCFEPTARAKKDFRPHYKGNEIGKRIAENSKLAQTYKIVSGILGKTLSSSDIELLYSMYDYYGLPPEVIAVMVEYFAGKGKTTMRKLEREAQKWSEHGVDSVEKAKIHIKNREELLGYAGTVRRIIGANERKLTAKELDFINKWHKDIKATPEEIREAYEITVENTGKVAFSYMNKILENKRSQRNSGAKTGGVPAPINPHAPESRYDYQEIQRLAFLKLNRESGEENGV